MFIELTPEQRQLQAALREYFSNLISPEEEAAMESDRHNEAYRAIIKRMGTDGKLGAGWPKEYGGLGYGTIEQSIFVNEAQRADVPLPAVTLQTVGPTLQVYGTEVQKKKFLPAILAGDRPDPPIDISPPPMPVPSVSITALRVPMYSRCGSSSTSVKNSLSVGKRYCPTGAWPAP